ncbi:MAG: thermostable hemolysin [Hyphomicrobiales bacterium]
MFLSHTNSLPTGETLSVCRGDAASACQLGKSAIILPHQIVVSALAKDDDKRRAAEALINRRYQAQFGIGIEVDYPLLLTLAKRSGEVLAAVGLRCAADGPLFLEQYLDRPIELELARHGLGTHRREKIVELGSLASVSNSASLYLVAAMAAYMEARRYRVATVTGTRRLRRLFSLFDFKIKTLAAARQERLADQRTDWGSYYNDDPWVLAGTVRQCFEAAILRAESLSTPARRAVLDEIVAQVGERI